MKIYNKDNKEGLPPAVLYQLKQLQPEIVSLLTHAPKFGTLHWRFILWTEKSGGLSATGQNRSFYQKEKQYVNN